MSSRLIFALLACLALTSSAAAIPPPIAIEVTGDPSVLQVDGTATWVAARYGPWVGGSLSIVVDATVDTVMVMPLDPGADCTTVNSGTRLTVTCESTTAIDILGVTAHVIVSAPLMASYGIARDAHGEAIATDVQLVHGVHAVWLPILPPY